MESINYIEYTNGYIDNYIDNYIKYVEYVEYSAIQLNNSFNYSEYINDGVLAERKRIIKNREKIIDELLNEHE